MAEAAPPPESDGPGRAAEGASARPHPAPAADAGEARFRAVVDGFGDPILIVDGYHLVRYINAAFLRAFGYRPADVIGTTLDGLLPPEERPAVAGWLAGLRPAGGTPPRFEHQILRADGGAEIVEVSANILGDPAGRPTIMLHLRVITEQRQSALVQAARFAVTAILAESPDLKAGLARAVAAIALNLGWQAAELWLPVAGGDELRVATAWPAGGEPDSFTVASRALACARDEGLPGRAWTSGEVIWAPDVAASALFLRRGPAAVAGLRTAVAVPVPRSGAVAGVMLFFSRRQRAFDGGLAAVLADLGRQLGQFVARKEAEAALEAERASLARRVAERTADLSRLNAELELAVRAKDAFLAAMSHELRTPLNTILALSEILLEQQRGPLNPHQELALRSVGAAGQHLLALINDILDLSKIEAGRLDLRREPVSVADICEASLLFVRELALKKDLRLELAIDGEPAIVEADAKYLKQMLVNLLSNAVKFTPAGGAVRLEVELRPGSSWIVFAVRDTGIGISGEDVARLFQPFTQLDSGLSRQHEGTGLGLVLVRRLAELHDGSVAVESEPGRGSCFTLTLPYRPYVGWPPPARPVAPTASASPAPPRLACHPAPARPLLLLVEDNESSNQVFGDYLRNHGYDVAVARHGREAVTMAAALLPDLVLLDIQMPELDGLEVARRLRAERDLAATPIVALTALAMPGDRERCLEAGASEYLSKPVSPRGLLATIRRLLGAEAGDLP